MIQLNSDLIELLAAFEKNRVRYLIVGGYAVGFHAEPRYTKDCDIWIATDPENAAAVHKTLVEFNAPLYGATPEDFEDVDAYFSFGAPPNRIDILMSPPGNPGFENAWKRRVVDNVAGVSMSYVSREDLVTLKTASGRAIDRRDIQRLVESAPAAKRKLTKKRAKKSSKTIGKKAARKR